MKMKSIKQKSILKQFYIYFLTASVIPLFVLVYILYRFTSLSNVNILEGNSKILIFIAAVFSGLGFWGTRSFLSKIVLLSNKLKEEKIDKNTILELTKGEKEGEVAHLAKVFADITTRLEENVKELQETKKTLYRVLSKVGRAITSTENFEVLIQFTLETTIEALGAKRGAIFFLDEEKQVLRPKVILGIDVKNAPQEIKIGEEAVGWVAKEKRPLLVPLLEEKRGELLFSSPLIVAPLIVHDKVWGVISMSGKKENTADNFSDDELKILSNLAYQIAVSFENAKLNAEAEKTYFETMSALALAVEAKDSYSRGHSESVAEYAVKIAKYMGLSQDELNTLRDASRLHDIGKIGIIDEILQKPGALNYEERIIMQKHPVIGEGIVKPLKSFSHILHPIKYHHEFLDGSGYPDGLKGEEIPLLTRILTVADIFDALTSNRPYRKALTVESAKKELHSMADNGKIDKKVVEAILNLVESKQI